MSDTETQPVVDAVEEGKKQEKKQKNVQQLAEARIKKAQKKKELDEERQADKKRLAELEQRLTQQAVAKVEADSSSDTEPDEPPKKTTTVVTKQPPLETDDEDLQPSFADEVKKVALMGALSLASFLVARKFNSSNTTTSKPNVATPPSTPKPAKRPAPQPTDGFIQPPAKRHIQPFAVPLPKTPVGTSGFFQ